MNLQEAKDWFLAASAIIAIIVGSTIELLIILYVIFYVIPHVGF
jgi:hypothetical protein